MQRLRGWKGESIFIKPKNVLHFKITCPVKDCALTSTLTFSADSEGGTGPGAEAPRVT